MTRKSRSDHMERQQITFVSRLSQFHLFSRYLEPVDNTHLTLIPTQLRHNSKRNCEENEHRERGSVDEREGRVVK